MYWLLKMHKIPISARFLVAFGDIFHVFAALTNSTEFLILCWLLFSVGWIILIRYLEIPLGGVSTVDTTVRIG